MAQNFEVDLEGGYSRIAGYERWSGGRSIRHYPMHVAKLKNFGPASVAFQNKVTKLIGDTSGATARMLSKLSASDVSSIRLSNSETTDYGPTYSLERYIYLNQNVEIEVYLYDISGTFVQGENLSFLTEKEDAIYCGLAPDVWWGGYTTDIRITELPTVVSAGSPEANAELLDRIAVSGRGAALRPGDFGGTYITKALYSLNDIFVVFALSASPHTAYGLSLKGYYPNNRSVESMSPSTSGDGNRWTLCVDDPLTGVYGGTAIGAAPDYLEVVRYSFTGSSGDERLYFATGNTKAFSFHFTGEVPNTGWRGQFNLITTGMSPDTPSHIEAHKNRLFLSFRGSLQFSAAGDPTVWNPVLGAGELAVGEDIIKLQSVIGGDTSVLLVYTETRIYGLYGDTANDFKLVLLASNIRVDPKSIQMLNRPIFLTDRGVYFLSASDTFGNFQLNALSNQVATTLQRLKGRLVSSTVVPAKNQYRLYFDNGEALYFTLDDDKLIGVMPIQYPFAPYFLHHYYDPMYEEERLLFTGGEGRPRIYQADFGPAFDVHNINAHLLMSFNHSKSAHVNKAYRKVALEVQADSGYAAFSVMHETDYGKRETLPTPPVDADTTEVNAYSVFDDALWDEFYWDGSSTHPQMYSVDGRGENISIGIASSSFLVWPFTISGITLQYIHRRLKR